MNTYGTNSKGCEQYKLRIVEFRSLVESAEGPKGSRGGRHQWTKHGSNNKAIKWTISLMLHTAYGAIYREKEWFPDILAFSHNRITTIGSMMCHVCPSLPSWAGTRRRWTSLPWSFPVATARRYFPGQEREGATSDRRSKVLWPFRIWHMSSCPGNLKKSKATLLRIQEKRRQDQRCHPRQEHLFHFIMRLNITGQRESDGL
jgi:hypothetical protein